VPEPRWLSQDEQRSWRAFLSASLLLHERLGRDMQRLHGLTSADYEILVRLSEAPDRRLRMTDLAESTWSSKSRLSHQITRMEEAGLVRREPCSSDRRGFFAVLTEQGWQRLVAAAPDHVASVREHLVDVLDPQQFQQLGDACGVVAEHLLPPDSPDRAFFTVRARGADSRPDPPAEQGTPA
jgi:DNA-binding MarR family transcriptional regulator